MKRLILILALALAPACASNKLVVAANAEHVAVVSVHAVIDAEAKAFEAGAYGKAKHQEYVAALLQVVQSEKALNDALRGWHAASGQPMPQAVTIAIVSLQHIVMDVSPLLPANNAVGALVAAANVAIGALGSVTGGKS